jgi:predicted RNA binding protein YcfA (HicA-like mRNA interferase family)
MKSQSSREVIKRLQKEGWELDRVTGSHHIFRHPSKSGRAVVPHPKKDMKPGTLRQIMKVAGWL